MRIKISCLIVMVLLVMIMIKPKEVKAAASVEQLITALNAMRNQVDTYEGFQSVLEDKEKHYLVIRWEDGTTSIYMNTKEHVFYSASEEGNRWAVPSLVCEGYSDEYSVTMSVKSDGSYSLPTTIWSSMTHDHMMSNTAILYSSYHIYNTQGAVMCAGGAWGTWGYFDSEYGKLPVYDTAIGFPLEFRYFLPGTYGQGLDKALLINNNIHDFQAVWKNSDDTLGYRVQIEYKGTYKVKKNWMSKEENVTTDYIRLAEVDMSARQWSKDEMYVDLGVSSPVYLDIVSKVGYKPSTTQFTTVEGVMRVRYVKYEDDKVTFGSWVTAYMSAEGNTVVVEDENGNIVDTPEYGQGQDYTGEDLTDDYWDNLSESKNVITSILSGITSIVSGVGKVPVALGTLLVGFPSEIWTLIVIGIGCMVALGIFKIIRG